MRPVSGYGSIDLKVSWNAGLAVNPEVGSKLIPQNGTAIDLVFDIQDELLLGSSMIVTASVTEDVENVSYEWYVNGESVETGPEYKVNGSTLGRYRVDVTAFTTNATQAGSASFEYRVVDNPQDIFEFDPVYPEAGQTVNVRITSSKYLFDPSVRAISPLVSYKGYDREYLANSDGTTTYSFNLYNLPGNDYQIVFYEQDIEKGRTSLNVSGNLYPFLTVSPETPVKNTAATFHAVSNEPHTHIHLIVTGKDGQVYNGNGWDWELIDGLYWWQWKYNTIPEEEYLDCTLTIKGTPRAQMRIYPQ